MGYPYINVYKRKYAYKRRLVAAGRNMFAVNNLLCQNHILRTGWLIGKVFCCNEKFVKQY